MKKTSFNYDTIPLGFYDKILCEEKGIRSFWHFQKFDAVLRCLSAKNNGKILDIGCSAGSFLAMIRADKFSEQIGIDIAQDQINYAQKYQTDFRKFFHINEKNFLTKNFSKQYFDAVTLIEVIEHLEKNQIAQIFDDVAKLLKTRGEFVITTPNYLSLWPFLEFLMIYFVKPSYEEQHITKFNYFNFLDKIRKIYPSFDKNFRLEFKSTSHLVTFVLAALSNKIAKSLAKIIHVPKWKMPFGAILIIKLIRK